MNIDMAALAKAVETLQAHQRETHELLKELVAYIRESDAGTKGLVHVIAALIAEHPEADRLRREYGEKVDQARAQQSLRSELLRLGIPPSGLQLPTDGTA